VFCPTCGQENAAGARTCITCGADLSRFSDLVDATVGLNKEYAGFWLRFAASIIDGILVGVVFWVVFIIIGIDFQYDFENPSGWFAILMLASYIVPWLYFALMEASTKQATLGKMALGIKVTDEAGNRVSFGRATGRYFGKIVSGIILYIGYIMIAFTKKKQGLHDILAGTLVVKK
jgi:uncharacterized RDD family membrane protein YckC